MLIQWPDRFYHTSADTLDKVDPDMLQVVGSLATAYAYWLAAAGQAEVTWLGHEMVTGFRTALGREVQELGEQILTSPEGETGAEAIRKWPLRAQYLLERQRAGLGTLLRLWPEAVPLIGELEAWVEGSVREESERLRRLVGHLPTQAAETTEMERSEGEEEAAAMVVQRRYPGPLRTPPHERKLNSEDQEALWRLQKEHREFYRALTLALYWCDGKRTLLEVADLVEQECGQRDVKALKEHFQLLEKMELVTVER